MEGITGWLFIFLNIFLVNFGYNFFKKKNFTNLKIGWIVLTTTWILLGILQGIVTQSFKESDKGKEMADEMADVLWVLICLANQTGVNLTEALEINFNKKSSRDSKRHIDNEKLKIDNKHTS